MMYGDRIALRSFSDNEQRLAAELRALKERMRTAEDLLSELLSLSMHKEKLYEGFLTTGHENRIRKFLCLLPKHYAR